MLLVNGVFPDICLGEGKEHGKDEIKTREQVPVEKTWDMTTVFQSDEEWAKEMAAIEQELPGALAYQGRLGESAETLLEFFRKSNEVGERIGKFAVYAFHKRDEDVGNSQYNGMYMQAMQLATKAMAATAWVDPEISAIPEEKLQSFLAEEAELAAAKQHFDNILRQKKFQLSAEQESILAQGAEIFGAPYNIYGTLSNADFTFDEIEDEAGNKVAMSHGRYGKYIESKVPSVRKAAYDSMYKTFGQFKNSCAATLAATVKSHTFNANVRGYASARAAALFTNNVSEDVYDNLVKTVNEHLPLLHRYAALRKKMMGLDELHFYDMYVPLVGEVDFKVTFEEAQEIILKALAPLGEDYLAIIRKAFSERWIDWADNKGKRSGAYSGGTFGTNPFILMTWQNNLNSLYTLIHELGHSVHSYYSRTSQPFYYHGYSIFLAEIASITNETLLTDYLLRTSEDESVKLFVINHFLDGVKGSLFRQTQFAEFEHAIHTADAEGTPLTADYFTNTYAELNKRYYGESLTYDDKIGLEWARIPHFYMNYYVFQYATGLSAASAFVRMIQEEGQPAVERYLTFLKAGCSGYPLNVLKKAGLDMTSVQPVVDAMNKFEYYLGEMEKALV